MPLASVFTPCAVSALDRQNYTEIVFFALLAALIVLASNVHVGFPVAGALMAWVAPTLMVLQVLQL